MAAEDVAPAVFLAATIGAAAAARAFLRRVRAKGRRSARDLVVGNLLVLAFLASLASLVGECWFRFAYDATDSFGLLRTTDRWFDRHYVVNNLRIRDDVDYDLGPRSAEFRRRVDFVGDSFTAGHGVADVEDRFANRVRAARPQWQVHVFARNGADTSDELGFLDHEADAMAGGRYAFDVVVLVYCLNDLGDITPEIQQTMWRVLSRRERGFAARWSYLFDWFRLLAVVRSEPDVADFYSSLADAYSGPIWDAQRARLRTLRDVVAAHGGRLAVVTFPFFTDLGPSYRFRDVHRKLDEFWRSENVPALDLLATFDGRDASDLVVGRYDAHPNAKAHAMAAAAILPFLDRVCGR